MVAPEAIAEILGLRKIQSVRELTNCVARGLPKKSVERLATRIFVDRVLAAAFQNSMIPLATYKRRVSLLSLTESERIERVARVLAQAEYVWDSKEEARAWLSRPHPELENQTPLKTAFTELGARQVESLLDRLFYGLPV
jgi:putative toxin-antitoxin system antitoxin component (TIGR02293 family)